MADKDKKKLKVILKLPKSSSHQLKSAATAAGGGGGRGGAVVANSSGLAFSAAPSSQFAAAAPDHRSKNVQSRHVVGASASSAPHSRITAPSSSSSSVRQNASGSATPSAAAAPSGSLRVVSSSSPSSQAPTPPKKRKFKTVANASAPAVESVAAKRGFSHATTAGGGPGAPAVQSVAAKRGPSHATTAGGGPGSTKEAAGAAGEGGRGGGGQAIAGGGVIKGGTGGDGGGDGRVGGVGGSGEGGQGQGQGQGRGTPPAKPAASVPTAKKSHKKAVKPIVSPDGLSGHPSAAVQPQPPIEKSLLEGVLDRLQKKDTYGVFAEPVEAAQVPDYYDIIKEPMDFGTMRKKIKKGTYTTVELFERDLYLICSNAMRYNGPDTIYYKQARTIRDMARKPLEGVRAELAGDVRKPVSHKKKPPLPPKKPHSKKPVVGKSRFDSTGSDFASGATLAGDGEPRGLTNASADGNRVQKGTSMEKLVGMNEDEGPGTAQAVPPESKGDKQDEPAGSALKPMGPKDGRRPLSSDEYHRNTYKPRILPAHGQGPPLGAVGGKLRHLIPVGFVGEHAYIRSLAQFGAVVGPKARYFVDRKIERVQAPVSHSVVSHPSVEGKENETVATPMQPSGSGDAAVVAPLPVAGLGGDGPAGSHSGPSQSGEGIASSAHPSGESDVRTGTELPSPGLPQDAAPGTGLSQAGIPGARISSAAADSVDQISERAHESSGQYAVSSDLRKGKQRVNEAPSVSMVHSTDRGMDAAGPAQDTSNLGRSGWIQSGNSDAQGPALRGGIAGPSGKDSSYNSGLIEDDSRKNIDRPGWTPGTSVTNAQDSGARTVTVTASEIGSTQDQGVRGALLGSGAKGQNVASDDGAASEESMNLGRVGWAQPINANAQEEGMRGPSLGGGGKMLAADDGTGVGEKMNVSSRLAWPQSSNVAAPDLGVMGIGQGGSVKGFPPAWNTPGSMHVPQGFAYPSAMAGIGRDDANAQAWAQARVMSLAHPAEAKRKLNPSLQGFHAQTSQMKLPTSLPQMLQQPHVFAEYKNFISRLPSQQNTGIGPPANSGLLLTQGQLAQRPQSSSGPTPGTSDLKGTLHHHSQSNIYPVPLQQNSLQLRSMPPDLNVALLSPSALQSPPAQQSSASANAHQPDLKLQL